MSEKRKKWFDPKDKPPEIRYFPKRFSSSTSVTVDECLEFLGALETLHERGRISEPAYRLFSQLGRLHPVHRLVRNLGTVLRTLGHGPVENIIRDGLTEVEYQALVQLERLNAPSSIRATAQGLLNVYERGQMVEAAQQLFQEERHRRWEIPSG